MPLLAALVLMLDQRIELQLPLVIVLAVIALRWQPGTTWRGQRALVALGLAAAYLVLNAAVTLSDPTGVSDSWWAAPVRVWLFYVLLIGVATALSSKRFDREAVFRTLEWLFVLKLLIVGFEGYTFLQTGEPREQPLFNMVVAPDTLLGVRFTSSYDFLFALLVLSPRRQLLRLSLLAGVIVVSETRALLLLSVLLLAWRWWQGHSTWRLAAIVAIPAALAIAAMLTLGTQEEAAPRVVQLSGSSLDDKLEQIDAVGELLPSPHLLIGRGLGASMPGIVRDEARPYSYEAQTAVLLWQGGLLFFAVHLFVICLYVRRRRVVGILLILGLGLLNPTLFSLASAFFLVSLGRTLNQPHPKHDGSYRGLAVHAQR